MKTHSRFLLPATLVILTCDDSSPTGTPGADGGSDAHMADAKGGVDQKPAAGAAMLDCGPRPPSASVGTIAGSMAAGNYGLRATTGSWARAEFRSGFCPGLALKSECRASVGSCSIVIWEPSPQQPGAPCDVRRDDAGKLVVEGGRERAELTFGGVSAGYASYESPASLWAGGETLRFSGTGGLSGEKPVPAFSVTLLAPNRLTFTSPRLPPTGTTATFERSKDLDLVWGGGKTGTLGVTVHERGVNFTDPSRTLTCNFPASSARGVVPAALLLHMPAGKKLLLSSGVQVGAYAQAGDRVVEISAHELAADGDSRPLSGEILLK